MTACPTPTASASIRRMPPPITPEALRAALVQHGTADAACKSLGWTKQGVYYRRAGVYQHPELVEVLKAHFADRGTRGSRRKLGEHSVAMPPDTLARLDAVCAERRAVVGPQRASRSAVAREVIGAAPDPLPAPEPGGRWAKVKLDLGPAWDGLAARLGTEDPQQVAGVVRAILASLPDPKKK